MTMRIHLIALFTSYCSAFCTVAFSIFARPDFDIDHNKSQSQNENLNWDKDTTCKKFRQLFRFMVELHLRHEMYGRVLGFGDRAAGAGTVPRDDVQLQPQRRDQRRDLRPRT